MRIHLAIAVFVIGLAVAPQANAQVPVIDSANLTKAQQIATSTQQILKIGRAHV